MRKILATLLLPVLLTSCGDIYTNYDSSTDTSQDYSSASAFDIVGRLNEHTDYWTSDTMVHLFADRIGLVDIWFSSGLGGSTCAVWAFNTPYEAEVSATDGTVPQENNAIWYGSDEQTGYGIVLVTDNKFASCNDDVVAAFNWGYLE